MLYTIKCTCLNLSFLEKAVVQVVYCQVKEQIIFSNLQNFYSALHVKQLPSSLSWQNNILPKIKWKWSHSVVSDSANPGTVAYRIPHPWDFPVKSTGVGCHLFLQDIFPTQGWNSGLLKCKQTLYLLSHQGNQMVFTSQSVCCVWLFETHGLQYARLLCTSPTPRAYLNSCPLSQCCHPNISSSVVPFSSCLKIFEVSESFPISHFCASGGQNIGVSASATVLLMNIQDWFLSGWTGWILQSKGFSRVFSNITVKKYQFFSAQQSLESNTHMHTWLLEKP